MKSEEFTRFEVLSWRTASFFFTASSLHRASCREDVKRKDANISRGGLIKPGSALQIYSSLMFTRVL